MKSYVNLSNPDDVRALDRYLRAYATVHAGCFPSMLGRWTMTDGAGLPRLFYPPSQGALGELVLKHPFAARPVKNGVQLEIVTYFHLVGGDVLVETITRAVHEAKPRDRKEVSLKDHLEMLDSSSVTVEVAVVGDDGELIPAEMIRAAR